MNVHTEQSEHPTKELALELVYHSNERNDEDTRGPYSTLGLWNVTEPCLVCHANSTYKQCRVC